MKRLNTKCRYIDPEGVCILENKLCDSCSRCTPKISYKVVYNPFRGVSTVSIRNNKGNTMIAVELFGQLDETTAHMYALDLCRILVKRGAIK